MRTLLKCLRTQLMVLSLISLSLFVLAQPTWAGTACNPVEPDAKKVMMSFELAHQVNTFLESSNAQLAIVARAGQNLDEYHLRYSHLGIIRKLENGQWRIQHVLNQCGTAKSGVYEEGLANFFMDDPFRFEALLLIPNPAVQAKLLKQLDSANSLKLHEANYNMLAFPFSTDYQNSNQWALEVMAAALAQESDITARPQAQAWLKWMDYQASTIELSAFTRLGARMFRANVSFDDHPFGRRMAGKIDTVTVESIEAFLRKRDGQLQRNVLSLQSN